ncbi:hypothetical protein PCE1_001237 [Barthelona sp. PCE]
MSAEHWYFRFSFINKEDFDEYLPILKQIPSLLSIIRSSNTPKTVVNDVRQHLSLVFSLYVTQFERFLNENSPFTHENVTDVIVAYHSYHYATTSLSQNKVTKPQNSVSVLEQFFTELSSFLDDTCTQTISLGCGLIPLVGKENFEIFNYSLKPQISLDSYEPIKKTRVYTSGDAFPRLERILPSFTLQDFGFLPDYFASFFEEFYTINTFQCPTLRKSRFLLLHCKLDIMLEKFANLNVRSFSFEQQNRIDLVFLPLLSTLFLLSDLDFFGNKHQIERTVTHFKSIAKKQICSMIVSKGIYKMDKAEFIAFFDVLSVFFTDEYTHHKCFKRALTFILEEIVNGMIHGMKTQQSLDPQIITAQVEHLEKCAVLHNLDYFYTPLKRVQNIVLGRYGRTCCACLVLDREYEEAIPIMELRMWERKL